MDKVGFGELFQRALAAALLNAEKKLGRELPRRLQVKLYGAGHSGRLMGMEEALDAIYIDEEHFHQIIDVGIVEVDPDRATAFVRVSPRPPVGLDETWNDPPGSGPFKQVLAEHIEESR